MDLHAEQAFEATFRRIVEELYRKFDDFRRAYDEGGMTPDDFDTFGPTRRTLRQFIEAVHQLEVQIRNVITPDPDGELS